MLTLKKELLEKLIAHCKKEFPNEACGLLAGKDEEVKRVFEMANVDNSPQSYFMQAKEQLRVMKEIRNQGLDLIGIYHSHVASEAYPSSRDVELAFYPDASYAIVTFKDKENPSLRSFKIKDGKITEEEIKILVT